MAGGDDSDVNPIEDLEELYKEQIQELMEKESKRIVSENTDPSEISRLQSLSVVDLLERGDSDNITA